MSSTRPLTDSNFSCGYVAVVGRPNVGKSTLINTLLGQKVSIVTPKPQTTRHRILGVDTQENHQAIYVDTPGIHRKAGKAMNRLMNRTAVNALVDADLIFFVTDASHWTDEDQDILERLEDVCVPVISLLNKIDKVHPKSQLLEALSVMAERWAFTEVIPICARRKDDVEPLQRIVLEHLPLSEPLFPGSMITDRSQDFLVSEVIREKLMLAFRQEVPYGLTVQIERFEEDEHGVVVHAIIWVEKDSQKGIVVGKGGGQLKRTGRSARLELKERFGRPVHLELWVKVKDNWADSEKDLLQLGFDLP